MNILVIEGNDFRPPQRTEEPNQKKSAVPQVSARIYHDAYNAGEIIQEKGCYLTGMASMAAFDALHDLAD